MWIHGGEPGNALYDLSKKLNVPLSDQENYNAVTTHSSAGPVVGAAGRFAYLNTARYFQSGVVGVRERSRAPARTCHLLQPAF